MTRQEQINAIKSAFYELERLDLQDGFRDVAERLYQMNLDSEKQHRQHGSGNEGITKVVAAKLFTISHLLDGFAEPDRFSVDDILSIRNEVLYAQAYAKRFHQALTPWAAKWSPLFVSHEGTQQIDYAKLMQAEEVQ